MSVVAPSAEGRTLGAPLRVFLVPHLDSEGGSGARYGVVACRRRAFSVSQALRPLTWQWLAPSRDCAEGVIDEWDNDCPSPVMELSGRGRGSGGRNLSRRRESSKPAWAVAETTPRERRA